MDGQYCVSRREVVDWDANGSGEISVGVLGGFVGKEWYPGGGKRVWALALRWATMV